MGNPNVAVALLSGGLDSCVVAAHAKHTDGLTVHALAVDYGQRHACEIVAAGNVATSLGLDSFRVIGIRLPWLETTSLTGTREVAKDRSVDARRSGVAPEYVPARNTLLIALAANQADALDASTILVGWTLDDFAGFPDCRPDYWRAVNKVLALGTVAKPVVKNQFGQVSKSALIFRGRFLGVPFEETWSCYDPVGVPEAPRHCGRCDACLGRREAFAEAGVPDPTEYAE